MSYINQSTAGDAPETRPTPEGECIASAFADRAEEMSTLLNRIHAFADRLSGGVPTALSKGGIESAGVAIPPLKSRLRQSSEDFGTMLKALHSEIERLEAFA